MWNCLSYVAAFCCILQVPIYLIYQIEPCVDYTNEQQCSMDIGSYTLICSITFWIMVAIVTQCLDPIMPSHINEARSNNNSEWWRIPSNGYYQYISSSLNSNMNHRGGFRSSSRLLLSKNRDSRPFDSSSTSSVAASTSLLLKP